MEGAFAGKVVVITGGAGGIGRELCAQLMQLHAKLVVLDVDISAISAKENLLAIQTDITDEVALKSAVEQAVDHFGQIDVLINNAGVTHISCFMDLSEDHFSTIMAVNFTASVNMTRLCLPYLVKTKGRIVAVSSVAGFAPLYGRTAYSASKHAMHGFFGSLAAELKSKSVSVTLVCPSFVRSRPELTTRANQGLSSPGAVKKTTAGEQIEPQKAAKEILDVVAKRKGVLYLGRVSKIAHWLFYVWPSLYVKVMTRGAQKEF